MVLGLFGNTHEKDLEIQVLAKVTNEGLPFDEFQEYVNDNRKSTSQAWKFVCQAAVSTAVIAFSMTMIATREGKEGVYLPVISGILGYWLPSPDYSKIGEIRKKITNTGPDGKNTITSQ